jgi:hypothetical protein
MNDRRPVGVWAVVDPGRGPHGTLELHGPLDPACFQRALHRIAEIRPGVRHPAPRLLRHGPDLHTVELPGGDEALAPCPRTGVRDWPTGRRAGVSPRAACSKPYGRCSSTVRRAPRPPPRPSASDWSFPGGDCSWTASRESPARSRTRCPSRSPSTRASACPNCFVNYGTWPWTWPRTNGSRPGERPRAAKPGHGPAACSPSTAGRVPKPPTARNSRDTGYAWRSGRPPGPPPGTPCGCAPVTTPTAVSC